ncbi:unnamed protein product [Amaranthus hypochondriacus]
MMISNKLSDKILKEVFNQQKEIVDEQNDELNVDGSRFYAVQVSASRDNLEHIDDFAGFSETRSQFDDYEVYLEMAVVYFGLWSMVLV